VFQKGPQGAKEVIEWQQFLFTKESKRCVFERGVVFERWTWEKEHLDPEKIFVRFWIFKEEEKSFVSLFYREGTFWRERILGVTDPLFKQQVLEVVESGAV